MVVQPTLRKEILPGYVITFYLIIIPWKKYLNVHLTGEDSKSLAQDDSKGGRMSQRSKASLPDSKAFPFFLLH